MVMHDHYAAWHRPPYGAKDLEQVRYVIDVHLVQGMEMSKRVENDKARRLRPQGFY
jgi:hypothetical protein